MSAAGQESQAHTPAARPDPGAGGAVLQHGAHLATALDLRVEDTHPYALGPGAHLTTVLLARP